MVKSILAVFVVAMLALPAYAQDDRLDELDFEEAPIKEEAVPYFAIGVGPVLTIGFPNLDDLNVRANDLGLDNVETPLFQWGGEFFTAIGFVPNMRVGFSWVGGSTESTKDVDTSEVTLNRTLNYSVQSLTFHLDYAFVPFRSFAILPGVGLGWGTQTISTFQALGDRTWEDYNIQTSPDMFSELARTTLYVMPRLNIEYGLTPFIAVRAQAAYTLGLPNNDWKGNRTSVVTGVPEGISVSAFSAQLGILIGLFN